MDVCDAQIGIVANRMPRESIIRFRLISHLQIPDEGIHHLIAFLEVFRDAIRFAGEGFEPFSGKGYSHTPDQYILFPGGSYQGGGGVYMVDDGIQTSVVLEFLPLCFDFGTE